MELKVGGWDHWKDDHVGACVYYVSGGKMHFQFSMGVLVKILTGQVVQICPARDREAQTKS